MPAIVLACLAYLSVALPGSTLGVLWPSMRLGFHQPVGALGILLAFGVTASVVSSVATGRLMRLTRVGALVPAGALLIAVALGEEVAAPSFWVFALGTVVFGLGSGLLDSAINAHAATHFGPRAINWVHASYGLGATIGPLAATAALGAGLSWRWVYGAMAVVVAAVACLSAAAGRGWSGPPTLVAQSPTDGERQLPVGQATPAKTSAKGISSSLVFAGLIFSAVETGLESAAGIWGYLFLSSGRGLSPQGAGAAVAAYWAMMFLGRAVLGPVAERAGPQPVLRWAVVGVVVGAALMCVPGDAPLGVVGMMGVGFAAAPIFPLFALTTARRSGPASTTTRVASTTTRVVTLQVAASAIGAATLPALTGVVIGLLGANALAPVVFVLALAMSAAFARATALYGRARPRPPQPPATSP